VVWGCLYREAPLAILSHLTSGCTVAFRLLRFVGRLGVGDGDGDGDGDVQLRALKVFVGNVHRRGSVRSLPWSFHVKFYNSRTEIYNPPSSVYEFVDYALFYASLIERRSHSKIPPPYLCQS
jgi:hypothetical protein